MSINVLEFKKVEWLDGYCLSKIHILSSSSTESLHNAAMTEPGKICAKFLGKNTLGKTYIGAWNDHYENPQHCSETLCTLKVWEMEHVVHTNFFSILQIHRTYNNVILHNMIIYMFGKLEETERKRVSKSIYYLLL